MPSLTSGARIGTGSSSALLRTAASLSSSIAAYQDSLQAYQYQNSAYTDTAFKSYSDYLKTRITSLNAAGGITNAQKVLTLTKTAEAAFKSNVSASITRANIQIMAGNASLTDKYNLVANQYARASSIGDLTLAQSLMSQAYGISQQIQYQAVTAATAASTLAKANNSAAAVGEQHVATNLKVSLVQLNNDVKGAGLKDFNSIVSKWVTGHAEQLKTLGVVLPKGAQPNYWDVVHGVQGAIYNAHMLAYQADLPTNPEAAQNYYDQAMAIASGTDKLPTLGGDKTAAEIINASANPGQYSYDQGTGKFIHNAQIGFDYGGPGNQLEPTYSASVTQPTVLSPQQTALMHKLGLNVIGGKAGENGVEVQATAGTPPWLKQVLGPNGVTNVFDTGKGGLQFEADAKTGTGKSYYIIGTDSRGLSGLFEQTAKGESIPLGGNYGFNAGAVNQLISTANAIKQTPDVPVASMPKLPALQVIKAPNYNPAAHPSYSATPVATQYNAPAAAAAAGKGIAVKPDTYKGISLAPDTYKGISL